MKVFRFLIIASILAMASSCAKEEASLSVGTSELSFTQQGGSQQISVSSNQSWTVTSSGEGFSVSPASGTGNGSITVTASPNQGYDSRTGRITVSAGGLSESISLVQAQKDAITIDGSEYELDYYPATLELKVGSNVDFTVDAPAAWVNVVSTKAMTESKVVLAVDRNDGKETRETDVRISGQGIDRTIHIVQKATAPFPETDEEISASRQLSDGIAEAAEEIIEGFKEESGDGNLDAAAVAARFMDLGDVISAVPNKTGTAIIVEQRDGVHLNVILDYCDSQAAPSPATGSVRTTAPAGNFTTNSYPNGKRALILAPFQRNWQENLSGYKTLLQDKGYTVDIFEDELADFSKFRGRFMQDYDFILFSTHGNVDGMSADGSTSTESYLCTGTTIANGHESHYDDLLLVTYGGSNYYGVTLSTLDDTDFEDAFVYMSVCHSSAFANAFVSHNAGAAVGNNNTYSATVAAYHDYNMLEALHDGMPLLEARDHVLDGYRESGNQAVADYLQNLQMYFVRDEGEPYYIYSPASHELLPDIEAEDRLSYVIMRSDATGNYRKDYGNYSVNESIYTATYGADGRLSHMEHATEKLGMHDYGSYPYYLVATDFSWNGSSSLNWKERRYRAMGSGVLYGDEGFGYGFYMRPMTEDEAFADTHTDFTFSVSSDKVSFRDEAGDAGWSFDSEGKLQTLVSMGMIMEYTWEDDNITEIKVDDYGDKITIRLDYYDLENKWNGVTGPTGWQYDDYIFPQINGLNLYSTKNLVKRMYVPGEDYSIDYAYQTDSRGRVSTMTVTSGRSTREYEFHYGGESAPVMGVPGELVKEQSISQVNLWYNQEEANRMDFSCNLTTVLYSGETEEKEYTEGFYSLFSLEGETNPSHYISCRRTSSEAASVDGISISDSGYETDRRGLKYRRYDVTLSLNCYEKPITFPIYSVLPKISWWNGSEVKSWEFEYTPVTEDKLYSEVTWDVSSHTNVLVWLNFTGKSGFNPIYDRYHAYLTFNSSN